MKTPADIVDELRVDIDMSDQQESQIIYEKWLKLDEWPAREIALPLIVGSDPEQWRAYVQQHKFSASEELFWHILANDLGKEADEGITVGAVCEWARTQTVTLHPSFLRIYEFVRKVMLSGVQHEVPSQQKLEIESERAGEHEVILGAALSLLSKMPEKCRDSNGFADGAKIAELIEQTAVKWFPMSPPSLSKEEMSALIDKWLE